MTITNRKTKAEAAKTGRSIKKNVANKVGIEKVEFIRPKQIFNLRLETGANLIMHRYHFRNFYKKFNLMDGKICIGIDPGTTNFGVTIFDTRKSKTDVIGYKCSLERMDNTFDRVNDFLLSIEKSIELSGIFDFDSTKLKVIVEGSAYANYREVELAELRGALAVWFYHKYNIKIKLVPPRTTRKQIFGDGTIRNPFENLQNDLAASYGICLMGLIDFKG